MLALGLLLAVLIGVALGFFGGGGSILTVPLLVYVFGLPAKEAIATSLLVVMAASAMGAWQHARAGNVRVRTALLFGSTGMLGAYLGGRAAAFVDGALLLLLFAAMMGLTSWAMWRGRRAVVAAQTRRSDGKLAAQGFVVGLFTGLVGAGGGFLIVPALALWAGLPMRAAIGTSLLVIVANAAAGLTGYATHVRIDWRLAGAVAAVAVAGSLLGVRFAMRIDPARLRKAFAGFVAATAIAILVREADLWLGSARSAMPDSTAQLVFVLGVLLLGIAAGRASQRAGGAPASESVYERGAGI